MKKYVKQILVKIRMLLLRGVSLSGITSALYYIFISKAFRREQQSVIMGMLKYYRMNILDKEAFYLLRRNIHRLEKGLIMKNRRAVFALEYIEETVDAFIRVFSGPIDQVSAKNLKWYRDVLDNYFEAVTLTEEFLINLFKRYDKHRTFDNEENSKNLSIPYKRDFDLLKVNYNDFYDLCLLRRSVRWYSDKKVPRLLIDKALKAAALSPSACNRQPFEFRIFDDPDLVQKVAGITWGTRGFHQNFPAIVVVLGNLEAYFDERDRHVIYIDGALASMSFMLALETLGLSSCPINWPDVDIFEKKMQKTLQLKKSERPIMLISLGYPDKDALVPFSEKKDLNELRTYNK